MTDTSGWVLLLAFGILFTFLLLIVAFWFVWWFTERSQGLSPYTGLTLRPANQLSYYAKERVLRFLHDFHQYDNRTFSLSRAAFCRETGRIFPNCITWFDTIRLDWSFLQKRYPGSYVSWGSLNQSQQEMIRRAHHTLEGFQTAISCPDPAPRAIDPAYIYTKPGPLYVDIDTKVLVGWKIVPETSLEVLIVQQPKS